MNICLRELKAIRKATIIWALSICGVAILYLSVYPSMAADMDEFKSILGQYPPAVQAMLGVNLDALGTLSGYYAMTFSFVSLCGAVQAMNLGLTVLSRESRERTADFLLTKPVSRMEIVTAKAGAALLALLTTEAVFITVSFIGAAAVAKDGFNQLQFLLIDLSLVFLQLIFFALGAAISVFFKKIKSVPALSLGIVFGLFFTGVLTSLGDSAQWERYLSPFRYFDTAYIINNVSYEPSFLVAGGAIIVLCAVVAFIVYKRKDIHSVS